MGCSLLSQIYILNSIHSLINSFFAYYYSLTKIHFSDSIIYIGNIFFITFLFNKFFFLNQLFQLEITMLNSAHLFIIWIFQIHKLLLKIHFLWMFIYKLSQIKFIVYHSRHCFDLCSHLSEIILLKSLTSIGSYYYNCFSITHVSL